MDNEARQKSEIELSIIVPMYNEEKAAPIFFEHIIPILKEITEDFEIICVNDGSSDQTAHILSGLYTNNNRIKLINLSRNFGKEYALTAGINFSVGDAVIPIDVDLQDPPKVIPDLVSKWKEGYDVVIAIRSDRQHDSVMKRVTSSLFYKVIGFLSDIDIPANAGDFRLMDRCVVDALKTLPERTRFMKGIFAWLGFDQATIYYERQVRSAGESKWKYWQLWNFALEGILSFTTFPLRIWTYLGFSISVGAVIYASFIIIKTIVYGIDIPGYASLLVVMLLGIGFNMIALGVFGEYLGRIFIEVKQRPLYLIKNTYGFDEIVEQKLVDKVSVNTLQENSTTDAN